MADIIESISGSLALTAGLYSVQDFLRNMGILNKSILEYDTELDLYSTF